MGRGESSEPFDLDMPVRTGLFEDEWSWAASDPSVEIRRQLTELEGQLRGYSCHLASGRELVERPLAILRDHRSSLGDPDSPALERLYGATTLALIRDADNEPLQGYARRLLNGLAIEPTHTDLLTRDPENAQLHIIPVPYDEEAYNETLCGIEVRENWQSEWPRGSFQQAASDNSVKSTVSRVIGAACPECLERVSAWSAERALDDDSAAAASAGLETHLYPVIDEEETTRLLAAASRGLRSSLDGPAPTADQAEAAARKTLGEELQRLLLEKIATFDSAELLDILLDQSLFRTDIERFVSENDPPRPDEWARALNLVDLRHLRHRLPERVYPGEAAGFSETIYRDELLAALSAIRIGSSAQIREDETLANRIKDSMVGYAELIEAGK